MATNVKRKKKAEVMSDDGSMTLTGHLKELRNRLIICAAVFVVGVIGFLAISDKLIDLLTAMAMNANYTFVFLAPQEKLMQYFRVSLIAAVIVTIPVALYQIYAFAKPGLKRSESFFFRLVLLFGLALFCVGVLFAYKVTLPFMLNFLVTLEGTDYITASISIESYINLCLTMFIIFGCVFEMPLVTIILAKMGIANPEIMKKGRGVAIVLIFLVAAIITPPDIVSQCFVAVPMCLLYFISIFLSGIFYKPKTDDDDEDEECDDPDCACNHHHDDEDEDEHAHHHHHHHHHGHDADEVFISWGEETHRKFTKAEIEHILQALEDAETYGIILRAKGYVANAEGEKWIHFDYVPGEPDIRDGGAMVTGRICVIGSKLNEEAVAKLFGVEKQ